MTLTASIYSKSGIISVCVLSGGSLINKKVVKFKGNKYEVGIRGFEIAVRLVRSLLDTIRYEESEVVFETNSSSLLSMIRTKEVDDMYYEQFLSVMDALDSLPIRYSFIPSRNSIASVYCNEKYIDRVKVFPSSSLLND